LNPSESRNLPSTATRILLGARDIARAQERDQTDSMTLNGERLGWVGLSTYCLGLSQLSININNGESTFSDKRVLQSVEPRQYFSLALLWSVEY
jgi:hypothetical protein